MRTALVVLLLLTAACQSSPPPTRPTPPQGLLEPCGRGIPAPKPPPLPRTVESIATAWNKARDANWATIETLRVCRERHDALVRWVVPPTP